MTMAAPFRGMGERLHRRAAVLLVCVLLLGALAPHTGLEQHGALDEPSQIFQTAAHLDETGALEPTRALDEPACSACVLQLQTLATAVPVPQRLAALVRFGNAASRQPLLVDLASPRLASSRGPPRA